MVFNTRNFSLHVSRFFLILTCLNDKITVAFYIASKLISWEICDIVPRTYGHFALSLTKISPAAFSLNLFYSLLFPPVKY